MNIAGYKLYSIETSRFSLDGGTMFGIIPKAMWEKEAPSDDNNCIQLVTRSLLLVGHGRKILVDSGNGNKWKEKFKSIYNISSKITFILSKTSSLFHNVIRNPFSTPNAFPCITAKSLSNSV